jgi:hypothetical protein
MFEVEGERQAVEYNDERTRRVAASRANIALSIVSVD